MSEQKLEIFNVLNFLNSGYELGEILNEGNFGTFQSGEDCVNYLVENGYFESDRLIEPPELKKILYEVLSEGDPDKNSESVKKIFKQLAERFTDVYYNDKKQIRGKDIFGLINIDDIWARFDDYLDYNISGKYDFDDDDDEDDDLDNDTIFDGDL